MPSIFNCYRFMARLAHRSEHPVHTVYFVIVALEAHGAYGVIAGVCALIMALTLREPN